MNHEAYDNIIDRYRSGLMSREEEQEFQSLLNVDPDLKRIYTADMVLDRVMTSDREMLPADPPQAYAHFLGLLAGSAPLAEQAAEQLAGGKSAGAGAAKTAAGAKSAAGAGSGVGATAGSSAVPAAGVAGTAAGAAAAKGTIIGSLLAGGAVKAIVGAVAVVGLAVGTYVTVPKLTGPSAERPAVEQVAAPAAPELRQQSEPTDVAAPEAAEQTAAPESAPAEPAAATPRIDAAAPRAVESKAAATRHADRPSKAAEAAPVPELSSQGQAEPSEGTETVNSRPKRLLHMKSDSLKAPVSIRSKVNSYDR